MPIIAGTEIHSTRSTHRFSTICFRGVGSGVSNASMWSFLFDAQRLAPAFLSFYSLVCLFFGTLLVLAGYFLALA